MTKCKIALSAIKDLAIPIFTRFEGGEGNAR